MLAFNQNPYKPKTKGGVMFKHLKSQKGEAAAALIFIIGLLASLIYSTEVLKDKPVNCEKTAQVELSK
jgi:hypothetical protein